VDSRPGTWWGLQATGWKDAARKALKTKMLVSVVAHQHQQGSMLKAVKSTEALIPVLVQDIRFIGITATVHLQVFMEVPNI
jgi:hypothetical protein